MKIFTTEQTYKADKFTIKKQQITSDVLMERAAMKIFEWMHARLQGAQVKIHLFCGIGNNGGDGIALARLLHKGGYSISVYVVNYSEKRSKDFLLNLERLKDCKVWPDFITAANGLPVIDKKDIVVDAIFGIGLNRAPSGWVTSLIAHINKAEAFVLAVDIPSGLFMDRVPEKYTDVIFANHVLSIQVPKIVFFLPQTAVYLDSWEVLDIGLDAEYLGRTETDFELVDKTYASSMYRPRTKFAHKGSYGHSLIVGGSYGKIGAIHLASKACLTVGGGLVTAFVPECGMIPLQTAVPEVMVLTTADERQISKIRYPFEPTAIGIGMGMGTSKTSVDAFHGFLDNNNGSPLVIDADGLNILSKKKSLLKRMPSLTVLTPHPKELERLIGTWQTDFEKLEKVRCFSEKYDCIVVIKGAHTITVYKDKGYVNSTGNPGMATAGSGDVLAGMITGLISQSYTPLEASVLGVFLHGLAGDLAVINNSFEALTASGIITFVGKAFVELLESEKIEKEGE
ncbi:MAG: NAD(P)H-hydrate dehydratase [Bacteroidota bacterium]